jgi:hypothetical protein
MTREEAATRIEPETAKVWFEYAQILDPYGEHKLSPEEHCAGRVFFAADPMDEVPVCWYDLPRTTREALERRRQEEDARGWRLIRAAGTGG